MKKKKIEVKVKENLLNEAFNMMTSEKSIKKDELAYIFEDIIRVLFRKKYGDDTALKMVINPNRGDLQLFLEKIVKRDDEIENEFFEIPLSKALIIDEDILENDILAEEFDIFSSFGRIDYMIFKQMLNQKISTLDKNKIYDQYSNLIGEMILGEVLKTWKNGNIVIHHGHNEIFMPKENMLFSDFWKKGQTISAVISDVNYNNNSLEIIASRTNEDFLQLLLEREIDDIDNGNVVIKKIARIPGIKSKVVVETWDDRIDPVSVCVGHKGNKLNHIKNELNGEIIDFIKNTHEPTLFMARLLNVPSVNKVYQDDNEIIVEMNSDQIGIAMGKNGNNVKLASMILDSKISIVAPGFVKATKEHKTKINIDPIVIQILEREGYITTKDVLALDIETLMDVCEIEKIEAEEVINYYNSL